MHHSTTMAVEEVVTSRHPHIIGLIMMYRGVEADHGRGHMGEIEGV